MSVVGELYVFSIPDIEKQIPFTTEVVLGPEYESGKSRIVLMENAGDNVLSSKELPIESFQLMLIANELTEKAPHVGIDIARPSLDMTGYAAIELFRKSSYPLGRAFRKDAGHVPVEVYQYTSHKNTRRSIYPRDMIMIPVLGGSQGGSDLSVSQWSITGDSSSDYTSHMFCLAMEKQLGMKSRQVPIKIQGGNIVVSRNFIFTLQDIYHHNQVDEEKAGFITKFIPSSRGNVTLGRDIAVLDFDLFAEGKQRVFHLDMLLNVVQGQDGKEYFLLANLEKAKRILTQHGFLLAEKFNLGRWKSLAGYPMYTKNKINELSVNLLKQLFSADGIRIRQKELEQKALAFEGTIGFSGLAHADIGFNIDQFFYNSNNEPLTQYIDIIRNSLLRTGVGADQIIDIPSLLFWDGYRDSNKNEVVRVGSTRKVPMYAPVNGIQTKGGPDKPDIFLTQGGVKVLDQEITKLLQAIGINHTPLYSSLGLGYAAAGFRCIAVPWR